MGSPTMVYVDPAIAADSGTGTIGDPYGDLQYAFNTVTRDATNGNQFNVKAGTSEIMAAALSFATYGTPTTSAPVVIRGYTSAANDGGIGVVSGNGSVACINSGAISFVKLVDMRFTNCGSALIISLSGTGTLGLNCEFDTTTGGGVSGLANVINCFLHNIGGTGAGSCGRVMFSTFRNETNSFVNCMSLPSNGVAAFNIIDIGGASVGVNIAQDNNLVMFNSIYSNGGTGVGIKNATTSDELVTIINNTIQGFSGSGGIGIQVVGQNAELTGYNLLYNNATNLSITGDVNVDLSNNDVAGASPFTNAGSDDFDPITALLASYPSYPTTWKSYTSTQQNLLRMAAQYAEGAGGGLLTHPGFRGGMNG